MKVLGQMKTVIGVCFVIILCLASVSVQAEYMQSFVNMEDIALFTADGQEPLQLADLELFVMNWLNYYPPAPSLAYWEMEERTGFVAYDSTSNSNDLDSTGGFVVSDATTPEGVDGNDV